MTLRRIDLNLLVVLDTLMTEQNVSRAADKLGLSQSAVSHALRRLRTQFADPLLVRGGKGMELSWRAGHIREPLRALLRDLEVLVSDQTTFDPGTSTRLFRLCVSDYVSNHLLGRVCAILRADAPELRIHVSQFNGTTPPMDDEIHVRLASDLRESPELRRERVLDDVFAVLLRKAHPMAARELTLEHYLALAHVKVAASAVGGNMIDDALARRGLERHVTVRLPNWANAQSIVESTDLAAAIPRHWAIDRALRLRTRSRLLPLPEVRFAIDVMWNRRFDEDPGHLWLRRAVIGVMREHATLAAAG